MKAKCHVHKHAYKEKKLVIRNLLFISYALSLTHFYLNTFVKKKIVEYNRKARED